MFLRKFFFDRTGGLICIVFGAIAIWESVRLYPTRMNGLVGDQTMPGIVGTIMVLLGIIMIFLKKGEQSKPIFPDVKMIKSMVITFILLFLYWFLIPLVGYVFATLLACIGLFKVIGKYNLKKSIIFSFIFTMFLYLMFIYWLKMPFPSGFLKM